MKLFIARFTHCNKLKQILITHMLVRQTMDLYSFSFLAAFANA